MYVCVQCSICQCTTEADIVCGSAVIDAESPCSTHPFAWTCCLFAQDPVIPLGPADKDTSVGVSQLHGAVPASDSCGTKAALAAAVRLRLPHPVVVEPFCDTPRPLSGNRTDASWEWRAAAVPFATERGRLARLRRCNDALRRLGMGLFSLESFTGPSSYKHVLMCCAGSPGTRPADRLQAGPG